MSEIYPYLTYIALLLKKDCPVLQCRNAPNLITHSIIDGHLVVSIFFFYCINILVHLLFGGYVCSFLLSVCPGLE